MNKILSFLCFMTLLACTDAADNERGPGKRVTNAPGATPQINTALRTQSYRDKGAKQIGYNEFIKLVKDNSNDLAYRLIPRMDIDNDAAVNINTSDHNNCGLADAFDTIRSKINNCAQQNPNTAQWNGRVNGNSGEGNWSLVYNKDDKDVVWLDESTGLLWSTPVGPAEWKEASGVEVAEDEFVCGSLELLSANVKWMLPTRNEFLQADLNGARFVLPGQAETIFWTATRVPQTAQAWGIIQETGELIKRPTNTALAVRCVGVPIR